MYSLTRTVVFTSGQRISWKKVLHNAHRWENNNNKHGVHILSWNWNKRSYPGCPTRSIQNPFSSISLEWGSNRLKNKNKLRTIWRWNGNIKKIVKRSKQSQTITMGYLSRKGLAFSKCEVITVVMITSV